MGWKGTVRSINAAMRAAEREAQREQRQREREQRQLERELELEEAAYEVAAYEAYVDRLLSVHKAQVSSVDWAGIAEEPEPERPTRSNIEEAQAIEQESSYSPGFLDRTFKLEAKKRAKLADAVKEGIDADEKRFQGALEVWAQERSNWHRENSLAKGVIRSDPQARLDAIAYLDRFADISEVGSHLAFHIGETGLLEATLAVHGQDVIPDETKSLRAIGTLSVKKMPKGRFNELHQDYVCSCVLRVAQELLAILPDEMVIVTAQDSLLNTATGHMEESPILSAAIPRSTLHRLNMQSVDPSDSMSNFVHQMKFRKTAGFSAVGRVRPDELDAP